MRDIRAAYKAATTEREKAMIEEDAWRNAPADERRNAQRRDYLETLFGATAYETTSRATVWNAGPLAEVLWERIDRDRMPVRTAANMIREARKGARQGHVEAAEVLAARLVDYDAKPVYHMANGRTYRKKVGGRHVQAVRRIRESTAENAWHHIETKAKQLIHERLQALPPDVAERIWTSFQTDLRALISEVQERLTGAQRRGRQAISRKQLVDACEALHMEPPRFGQPVDLERARRQKKKLAHVYHPDTSQADDASTRALFQATLEAFRTIETYAEQTRGLERDAPTAASTDRA